jgi:hypothetical protein
MTVSVDMQVIEPCIFVLLQPLDVFDIRKERSKLLLARAGMLSRKAE